MSLQKIIPMPYQNPFSLQHKKNIEQGFGFALLNVRLKQKNTSLFKGKDNMIYFLEVPELTNSTHNSHPSWLQEQGNVQARTCMNETLEAPERKLFGILTQRQN